VQGSFGFNGSHRRAEQLIAETAARLVTEIGSPGTEVIREIIFDGQRENIGVQKTAQRLAGKVNPKTGIREGGIMGLDGARAQRWRSVSDGMKTPEGVRGLVLEGRDGKLKLKYTTNLETQKRIFAAYNRGEAVPADGRARLERQFSNHLLKKRGQTIAANEKYTAQAQGRAEAYQQLMESGKVETIKKRWQHASAKDPRHDHQRMDGKEVDISEGFVMDDGTVMAYPHDPSAPAKHTLNCRCTVIHIPQFRRPT
jgi:hypothetical protein